MRTTIVCGGGYVSGKEIVALELADGLRQTGDIVRFVTSAWHDGDLRRRLEDRALPYSVLPIGFISATVNYACVRMTVEQIARWPMLLFGYSQLLEAHDPDRVVHTNWHHLVLLWPLLSPTRDVFWVHETIALTPRYGRIFRSLDRRLKGFIAVSDATRRSLLRLGIAPERIQLVHAGIVDPGVTNAAPCNEYDGVRLGIVGQIAPWKGHEDLLEAVALLRDGQPAIQLHVFGRGTDTFESYLRQRAIELAIANRVVWHGFVSNPANIYRQFDVCVVPSRFEEPFGMVAVEASFCGLPVVATRTGGLPEIVKDGETGLLCEAGNPQTLATCLRDLVRTSGLRRRLGSAARARAVALFSRERFIRDFRMVMDAPVAASASVQVQAHHV